jgi:hypothetical protein
MRLLFGMIAVVAFPAVAGAQTAGAIVATPLAPPTVLTPPTMLTPTPDRAPQEQAPSVPSQGDTTPQAAQPTPLVTPPQTTTQTTPPPDTAPSPPQPIQLTWQPQGSAQVQVLDKVNAQSTVLDVKVGQQGKFGSLTIQVQACRIHPADQARDSAAYLTITDSHADVPGFQGWMLANEPSASMLQSPIYDVRVVGCQA